MKQHNEFAQGSLEWHQMRYRKIGGAMASGLLIESSTLMLHLLSENMEDFQLEDGYVSPDMERGIELQPEALRRLNLYLENRKIELIDCGYLSSEENKLIGFSPDGISQCEKYMCEIKCPAKKKHTETIFYNAIPKDNLAQCIYAFLVNENLESLFFLSFRPESIKPMFVKELTRQSVVDMGAGSKPNNKMVQTFVELMKINIANLEKELNLQIEKLKF